MQQMAFAFDIPDAPTARPIPQEGPGCIHDRPLLSHCPDCEQLGEEAHAWCEAEIAAGRYNRRLFTPREWAAALKRGTVTGRFEDN